MRSSSVLMSVIAHASAVAALVIVPLLASSDLPAVRTQSAPYIRVHVPRLPQVPPAPPPQNRQLPRTMGAPLEAPSGISPEPPVAAHHANAVAGGLEPRSGTGVPFELGFDAAFRPPSPPPTAPPTPVRIGGTVRAPRRIAYVVPEYPSLARAARMEGEVYLEAVIGVDGNVQHLRVLRTVPLLEEAAIEAVRQWRYTPTLLNGTAVPVVMTVRVSFRLR